MQTTAYCSRITSRACCTAELSLVLLARGAAHAEEGVGALEHLNRVRLHDGAALADGVALLDDVVAGVEPREGEVAVAAALELARVDVDGLALTDGCMHACIRSSSHSTQSDTYTSLINFLTVNFIHVQVGMIHRATLGCVCA